MRIEKRCGDLRTAMPPRVHSGLRKIAVGAEPLLHQRRIPLLVRGRSSDSVRNNSQAAIEATRILVSKEAAYVALDIEGGELVEAGTQEALEHDHVAAQRREDGVVPVRLDVGPQQAAAARVRRQRDRRRVPVLYRHLRRKREGQQVLHQVGRLRVAQRLQRDLLAVGRDRRAVVLLDGLVGVLVTVVDDDAKHGASQAGVNGGRVVAGGVGLEALLRLGDDPGIMLGPITDPRVLALLLMSG